jgi:hypothetical protein
MNVKEAVALAKKYITEVFAEEPISELGLEEIDFDESSNTWLITLGFVRNWQDGRAAIRALVPALREYKTIRIADADKKIISVKNR